MLKKTTKATTIRDNGARLSRANRARLGPNGAVRLCAAGCHQGIRPSSALFVVVTLLATLVILGGTRAVYYALVAQQETNDGTTQQQHKEN